jgi:hypothetical protein
MPRRKTNRRRNRDTTADAIGLTIKRRLLEQAVRQDPEPEIFEQWLMQITPSPELQASSGAIAAMARGIFEEWRMARALGLSEIGSSVARRQTMLTKRARNRPRRIFEIAPSGRELTRRGV